MFNGTGCSKSCNSVGQLLLCHSHAVGIAFYKKDFASFLDAFFCLIKIKKQGSLDKVFIFTGVIIFGSGIMFFKNTTTKTTMSAQSIFNGENESFFKRGIKCCAAFSQDVCINQVAWQY